MISEADSTKEKFTAKTAKKKVYPRTLPLSSIAAKFQIWRAFHTVQAWLGEDLDLRNFSFYEPNGTLE